MRHEKYCFTNHIIRKLMHYYMADSKIGSSGIELGIFIMDVPPELTRTLCWKNELDGYNVHP